MASIFTYDPDPPRVSSPWSTPPIMTPRLEAVDKDGQGIEHRLGGILAPPPTRLADCGMSKLEAEPQEGPTEYKLHLLLRPRRKFTSVSTERSASGSYQSRLRASFIEHTNSGGGGQLDGIPSVPVPTLHTRQNRLQHLTTQLLWRLQQSSAYHSSTIADLALPRLPETTLKSGAPTRPEKLLPGLEESRGALYEIGVSDDGTLVGLAKDEMHESLTNLRAMAASLGCKVEILRVVIVGSCEWSDTDPRFPDSINGEVQRDDLLVAEVLILPETTVHVAGPALMPPLSRETGAHQAASTTALDAEPADEDSRVEQLRISLTGSTTSGKSSLLGTLSTSTLDNGRGKSRLSLLKHRHELASGVTSSVAPELIGYNNDAQLSNVVNYGSGNVSSWNDIHSESEGGRLVFLVDSAGHPRYRRTTVRGIVSWAPHWTLCCIAADDASSPSASLVQDVGNVGSDGEKFKAHLELCLKLRLPLIVVITKYDLASRAGLRQILAKVLSIIKDVGRKPAMLKPRSAGGSDEFHKILPVDEEEIQAALSDISVIPIVLTSAVTGDGIGKLHALLRHLPIPSYSIRPLESTTVETLFHIDEVYTKPAFESLASTTEKTKLLVASGHIRYGTLSIGDTLLLGPFAPDSHDDSHHRPTAADMHRARSYPSRLMASNIPARPGAIPRPISGDFSTLAVSTHRRPEFLPVKVVSVRNLRLPLRRLHAGQAGTVGVELPRNDVEAVDKARKGMVLATTSVEELSACAALVARFHDDDYHVMQPGSLFNVYVASVRAAAKIISVRTVDHDPDETVRKGQSKGDGDGVFGFEEEDDVSQTTGSARMIDVEFQLMGGREWIEVGAQVLVMPSMSAGLEGFVGSVVDILD